MVGYPRELHGLTHSFPTRRSSDLLLKSGEIVCGDAKRFDHVELYSCFPVVPKMALRTLGLDASSCTPTVAGGLTFFGGPLNNYMSHAVCAMVRILRAAPQDIGDRKSTRLNSSHYCATRMPSYA